MPAVAEGVRPFLHCMGAQRRVILWLHDPALLMANRSRPWKKGGGEMKLPRLSGREVLRALAKTGFQEIRRHGSRVYLEKAGPEGATHLMVRDFKELDPKALMDIIHQAGLNRDEFLELLK